MENVVVINTKKLEELKNKIRKDGAGKIHILADFDRTLTTAFVDGCSRPSLISVLRDGNYLTPDYAPKAHELYNKYHPIEIDPKIPKEEKKKAMEEWWETHFNLLIRCGLNRKDLETVVSSEKVKFRQGFADFMDFLKDNNIPLVIMSSSGLGGDIISMYLKNTGKLYNNTYIISNTFVWDEKGNAVAVKQPIIHGMNKDETIVHDFPDIYKKIKDRKNIILLGDNIEDIGMIGGFEYQNIIKVGFLNENIEANLENYKNNFDAIILKDGPMDFINNLLKDILQP